MRKGSLLSLAGGSLLGSVLMFSCASIGTPSGGARDEEPPVLVGSTPARDATEFKRHRVELTFNELVAVKDAFTNVTVSPMTASTPRVTASGRKVIVNFDDTLLPATTYNIDFGNSIRDNNEGNVLENFSFSFSTGADLDTLRLSGIVLDAATLEPQQGVLVGVYSNLADTAFKTLRMERGTRTDDHGRFVVRGLKARPYRLVALNDLNNDGRWDNPEERLAFYHTLITPWATEASATDTIWNTLTGRVDTVMTRLRTRFEPADILLSMFSTGYKSQYLVKYERPDSAQMSLIFNTRADSLPGVKVLRPAITSSTPLVAEFGATNDSITYWFADKALSTADTVQLALTYPRTVSGKGLVVATDTLDFVKPKIRAPKVAKKRTSKELQADSIAAVKASQLGITAVTPMAGHEVWSPVTIDFAEPLKNLSLSGVRVEQKVDTLWHAIDDVRVARSDSGHVRRYTVDHDREYGATYRLTVDSLAAEGISGRRNAPFTHQYVVKKEDDYARLTLRIEPDSISGFVEVLSSSDQPVAHGVVKGGTVVFPYLAHADYYVRFVADANGNDKWDAGDYDAGVQPEDVYYYPKILSLKRFDRSEQWDLNSTAVDMQKPAAIKKNKPASKNTGLQKKKSRNEPELSEEDDFFTSR